MTKRFPHGGRHFQKIYGGFWRGFFEKSRFYQKKSLYLPTSKKYENICKKNLWKSSWVDFTVGKEVGFFLVIEINRPSKPTIDFLEMPTPMGESVCHLVRLDVKNSYIFLKKYFQAFFLKLYGTQVWEHMGLYTLMWHWPFLERDWLEAIQVRSYLTCAFLVSDF